MFKYVIFFLCLFFFNTHILFAENQISAPDIKPNTKINSHIVPDSQKAQNVMTDIHDIQAIEKTGFNTDYIKYILYALICVLIVLLIWILFCFYKKRKRRKIEKQITIPCHELALNSLNKLSGLNGKEFYFTLSSILRDYIYRRFDFNAPEMTSEEFVQNLNKLRLEKSISNDLKQFINSTDPIKFAKALVDKDKMQKDLEFVKNFVFQTKVEEIKVEKTDV